MRCPVDGETLVMTDRNGVEIDYCPKCRGVWLDRGELDKIIERSGVAAPPSRPPAKEHKEYEDSRGHGHAQGHKKSKGSFLGDLFDF